MVDRNGDRREGPIKPGDELYEIRYLAEELNVSEKRVAEAMKIIGNDRGKLEAYFRKKLYDAKNNG
jgi:DNA-binding transcriptional MocR family regulator